MNIDELINRMRASRLQPKATSTVNIQKIVILSVVTLIALTVTGLVGCPHYEVWQQGLKGEAELKRAEQNRHVRVYEAEAELESSKLKAQSEVERAKGVAQANEIISDGLKGHEEYLRYLWIDRVASNPSKEIIYVPTEANLPILEAGRRGGEKP